MSIHAKEGKLFCSVVLKNLQRNKLLFKSRLKDWIGFLLAEKETIREFHNITS